MKKRPLASALIGAAAAAAALWMYASHAARRGPPAVVPIQDAKTIDFSGGAPVVRDAAADKAAMDAALRKMDAASADVTFPADPPKK